MARRFAFITDRYEGAVPAIGCDGLVPGAALDLTHWQGNRTPAAFRADTSTEIALNFVASPESSAWGEAVVVNNHFDTDGALSAWTLLEPEWARANRDLLIAAAEAGDFDEWPRLDAGLHLDAAVRALGAAARDDADAYAIVLPQLADLIATLESRRDLWGGEWEQLQEAVRALEVGRLQATRIGPIGVMEHGAGMPEAPGALLARQFLPGARRYLLAFAHEDGGHTYRYERPRYAWAETVDRLPCPEPDAASIANALGDDWTDADLPGMTGIVRTVRPIADRPEAVVARLGAIDPPIASS